MTGSLIKWFEIKSFRQRYSAGWVYGLRATKHSKNTMSPCRLLPQRYPGQPTERVSQPGCSAVGLQPPLSPFGAEPLMRAVSARLGCCGKVLESIRKGHYRERQVLFVVWTRQQGALLSSYTDHAPFEGESMVRSKAGLKPERVREQRSRMTLGIGRRHRHLMSLNATCQLCCFRLHTLALVRGMNWAVSPSLSFLPFFLGMAR